MLKKNWHYFLYLLLFFLPRVATAAFVDCDPNGQGVGADGRVLCTFGKLLQTLQRIYNWLLGFSALVALLFIIIGGLRMFYWTFMENADQELKDARYTITRAVTGLIIIAAAYLIVNTLIAMMGGGTFLEIYNRGFNGVVP